MNLDELEHQVLQTARREMSPSGLDAKRVRTAVVTQIGLAAMGSAVTISGTSAAASASLVSTGVVKAVLVSVLAISGTAAGWGVHRYAEKQQKQPIHAPQGSVSSLAVEVQSSVPMPTRTVGHPAATASISDPSSSLSVRRANASVAAQRFAVTNDSTERERLGEEVWLLKQADQALRGHQPEVALKQLNELAARAPNGTLMQEREAIRALAQCSMNQAEPARSAGYRFLEQYPTSIYAARIRVACALTQTSSDGPPHTRTLPKQEKLP